MKVTEQMLKSLSFREDAIWKVYYRQISSRIYLHNTSTKNILYLGEDDSLYNSMHSEEVFAREGVIRITSIEMLLSYWHSKV